MGKLKAPELNAFRYGTLTAAEFATSKRYPDRMEVKLTGNWEGEGEGYWYANWKVVTALCAAGMLTQLSGDGKMFQVTPGTRCCIYRQKGEGEAHDWFVAVYDAANKQVTLQPAAVPFTPQAVPAAPPPNQAGPTSGSPPSPPPQMSGHPSAPGTPPVQPAAPAPANGEARAGRDRLEVAKVDLMLGMSLAIAAYWHVKVAGKVLEDLDEGAVQDSAACVMIRLEKVGYNSSTDRTKSYLKRLARLHHQMDPDKYPPVPDDVKGNGAGQAKPKKEAQVPAPVPAHVSSIPGAESLAGKTADGLDLEDDDLPF